MGDCKKNSCPIGVFDSGVGGLTVMREIVRQNPDENVVYFGDTARVPYGGKSKETVLRYSRQIVRFLQTQNVKAIVVACNTATAWALEELEKELDIPIIGVIRPGAKVASLASVNGRIGVIATKATVKSGIYTSFIKNINPELTVVEKPCPLFVPLVEEHMIDSDITRQIAEMYLQTMKEEQIDTLVLGCTHYPLLRSMVRSIMGPGVKLVNPAYETAVELKRVLEWNELQNDQPKEEKRTCRFYVSDEVSSFEEFAESILEDENIAVHAEQIKIEEY